MNRLFFGGVLAIVLLGLYLYALAIALGKALSCSDIAKGCPLDDGVALLLQTLGALVAAVVVSELSVTAPNEAPGTRIANAVGTPTARQQTTVKSLTALYIFAWVISGLALIVVGWIQHPGVPQVVSAAKEWLGFGIGAAYAYFGVSRP